MENKVNDMPTNDAILAKHTREYFAMDSNIWAAHKDILRAMTEYSDLKCQPLLARIKELDEQNNNLMSQFIKEKDLNQPLKDEIIERNNAFKLLKESADKLAETIEAAHSNYRTERMKKALTNYRKLKEK